MTISVRITPAETVSMAKPLVLLVDDDEDVRLMTRVNLGFEGFDVREAVDGHAGLAAARELHPDVIVLDVMMPGLDGLDVLRALREDSELADIPVALLTARAGATAENEGWTAGANAYLTKPFTSSALASTLRRLLAEDADGRGAHREAAQARIDLASRLTQTSRTMYGTRP